MGLIIDFQADANRPKDSLLSPRHISCSHWARGWWRRTSRRRGRRGHECVSEHQLCGRARKCCCLLPLPQNSLRNIHSHGMGCWSSTEHLQAKTDHVSSSSCRTTCRERRHKSVRKLTRRCSFIGCIGYPLYVGGLWYFDRVGHSWFSYFGGVMLGVTAGCLWTGAGYIAFSYAEEWNKGKVGCLGVLSR